MKNSHLHGTSLTAKLLDESPVKVDNPIKIGDLTFRDGHQSLFATRGRTEDLLPIAEEMEKVGYWSMEVWGGATFDTMHRFLNEDPWERPRQLKKYLKKTKLMMLLRGQNLVGYRNYADDMATAFVERASQTASRSSGPLTRSMTSVTSKRSSNRSRKTECISRGPSPTR